MEENPVSGNPGRDKKIFEQGKERRGETQTGISGGMEQWNMGRMVDVQESDEDCISPRLKQIPFFSFLKSCFY
jgi:hypothetical protein